MNPAEAKLQNEPALKELERRMVTAGFSVNMRNLSDTLSKRVIVIGPITGYRHQVTLKMLEATTPAALIEDREQALLRIGYRQHGDWTYELESEDADDRYYHFHYAVHETTGERKKLDISPSRRNIHHEEFRLHVALGFPDRDTIKPTPLRCPIDWYHLETWVFSRLTNP